MRASSRYALAAVVLAAVWIRLSPLLHYLYWGSDVGEYHAIVRGLLASWRISTSYEGWGATYPYFPGMFHAIGGAAGLGGIDAAAALSLLGPTFGALAVLPVFLLGTRLSGEAKVGLFAAGFVAVVMPHVYPTSHAAPGTLGDLFAFAALLLFLRARADARALVPLLVVSAALVVTHHLSTYFLVLMVIGTLVLEGLARPRSRGPEARLGAAYAAGLLAMTGAYWFGYATTFRDGILRDVDVDPWWLLLAAFPAILVALWGAVLLRRRVAWRYRPRQPDFRRSFALYLGTLGFVVGLMAFAAAGGIPGTSIVVPGSVLYYFAPVYVLVSLSAAGRKFLDFQREGTAVTAWLVALLGSAAIGIVAAPRVVIPYRHIEYVIVPLALLAGVGFFRLLDLGGVGGGRRTATIAVAGLLLASGALTAFPPPEILGRWQEGSRVAAVDAAYWARDHVDGLLLADHRASTLAFGFGGVDGTWDTTRGPLAAATFADARAGMVAVPAPSGPADVRFVWVDHDTERGIQLFPWEPAAPMSPAAIAKFSESPFVKVYDSGYARLYWVAWGCDESC